MKYLKYKAFFIIVIAALIAGVGCKTLCPTRTVDGIQVSEARDRGTDETYDDEHTEFC